ncbi:hypothetical protein LUZ61_015653 [Rhynchospora tenuis]|uniref:KIB1-4 beta-propeller domain-containing protein n=1 Tax=Rhynchospora tenuis TaxID=198213 RepID=A0AAD5Z425_9POAL|nr:hypothetical protein LUZ61_015653 [Rhynchospora tenuis]
MEMEMQAVNEGEQERDWAYLPPDMLNHIAKCLGEIFDFVRFRAVCHAWRTSTPITDLPTQFPWILENREHYPPDPNLRFYSLPFNKTYTIPAPRSLDKKYLLGPYSNGYMTTVSQQNHRPVSILNPLTNHEIYLSACPSVCDHHWIGPRQNQRGEHVVICYGRSCSKRPILVFCHPGQSKWHKLKLGSAYKNCRHFYLRVACFSVYRFALELQRLQISLMVFITLAYAVPPPCKDYWTKCSDVHLVEDSLGDILRVTNVQIRFNVYRLDVGNKNGSSPCWVKVSDIGNQAIFIDMDGTFVLKAGELSQIERNSIYLLETVYGGKRIPPSYNAWRTEIDTCKSERLQCPLKEPESWFVPNLHHL